jgi:uncharacterized protein
MVVRAESPFVVKLREIPPEGLAKTLDLRGEWAEHALQGTDAELEPRSDLHADVELQKAHADVLARGKLVGVLTVPCSRCLTPAAVLVNAPFEMTFVPAGAEPEAGGEIEVTEELADLSTYENDEVDLEEMLREELLLALPMTALCTEACKGLCPTCGKNLNEGPCTCEPAPKDDRWAALKNLKL